jgi:hypothetical protein
VTGLPQRRQQGVETRSREAIRGWAQSSMAAADMQGSQAGLRKLESRSAAPWSSRPGRRGRAEASVESGDGGACRKKAGQVLAVWCGAGPVAGRGLGWEAAGRRREKVSGRRRERLPGRRGGDELGWVRSMVRIEEVVVGGAWCG